MYQLNHKDLTKQLSIRIYDLKISPVFKVQMLTTEPLHSKQQITLRIWYPNTLQTWLLLKNLWYSTIRSSNKMLVHWEAWITLLSNGDYHLCYMNFSQQWTSSSNFIIICVHICVFLCVCVCIHACVHVHNRVCVCVKVLLHLCEGQREVWSIIP